MERLKLPQAIAEWNESGKDFLPGYLGMEFVAVEPDEVVARMRVELHKPQTPSGRTRRIWLSTPEPASRVRGRTPAAGPLAPDLPNGAMIETVER